MDHDRLEDEHAARQHLTERYAQGSDRKFWDEHAIPLADYYAAVNRAASDGDQADITAALTVLGEVRAALERRERDLLERGRAAGISWRALATALGLRSAQAAEQRALRLSTLSRDAAAARRYRQDHQQQPHSPTGQPGADGGGQTHTPATQAHTPETDQTPRPGAQDTAAARTAADSGAHEPDDVARSVGFNETLKPTLSGSRRAGRDRPTAATVADFDADDTYGLNRERDGVYVVTEHGARIGAVRRRRTRTGRSTVWEPWTDEPYAQVGGRTYDTRAQAALMVVDAHRRGQQTAHRRRRQGRTGLT